MARYTKHLTCYICLQDHLERNISREVVALFDCVCVCVLAGFQELSLHDQVQLLESSWLEVLMIGLIWRSIHCPGKLIFAQDLILDR